MTPELRTALDQFVAALEAHAEAAAARQGENDADYVAAYQRVAATFDAYDDALYTAYNEVTPLAVYTADEDDDEDDDLDEDIEDDEEEDEDLR